MKRKARVIAFYLPQFHPTAVNDQYWGKGFTEWTNVAKAKPLYKGHYQPQIPADLGFYDLRVPEIRQAQADMAYEAGIEGFCYWNYWFGNGEKVLEMPIEQVMATHKPDFPFCIGWANHDWSNKTWQKSTGLKKDIVFLKQKYLGEKDYKNYFDYLLPMFLDDRYIQVDGKPLFYVFAPEEIPDMNVFIDTFNRNAIQNGLKGIFFVGRLDPIGHFDLKNEKNFLNNRAKHRYETFIKSGYDAVNSFSFRRAEVLANGVLDRVVRKIKSKIFSVSMMDYDYQKVIENLYMQEDSLEYVFPTLCPHKDRTPRSGKNAWLYRDSTPEKFRIGIKLALQRIQDKPYERKILFLDSWNEWGEGAYMEPDIKFKHQYLDVLKSEIFL